MSETISSSALFHITGKIDHIKSILAEGFFPHYCPEYTLDGADRKAGRTGHHPMYAIPMVCLCDLPLSLIKKHLKEYGMYGIGLDKTWGVKNGVAPVIYTHNRAKTRPSVSRLVTRAPASDGGQTSMDMSYLAAYSKPFEGPAWRNGRREKEVRFYDEREWRYVPADPGAAPLFLPWNDYDNVPNRRKLERRLKKQNTLHVPPDDVMYLILPPEKDEQNVIDLHDFLMKLYPRRRDAILVATTIMTTDCIEGDI